MRFGCLICHKIRNTERGMFNHLIKKHTEIVSCHLHILDSFSCEEGSIYWKKYIAPTIQMVNSEEKNGVET